MADIKTEPVKGFRDFSGEEAWKREEVRKILVDTFENYGFEPAETPIIEREEFVKGENSGDEAVSDIFKLKDKGERSLALRYEFTFQLKRLSKGKKLPYKRYQIGSVFRDEPTSKNRFRQFTQCDIDTIGSSVKEEAEIIAVAVDCLKKLGVEPLVLVNNRRLLDKIIETEILEKGKINEKDKLDILREIDKYDKLSEKEVIDNLRKLGAEDVLDLLKRGEKFFNQYEEYKEVLELMEYCIIYGIETKFAPTMVRGLSYYNGSVFEIKAKGVKETIAGGGSYKINNIQSAGISFGLERLNLIAQIPSKKDKYLVISLDEDKEAIKLARKLRNKGEKVSMYYGKPSKSLEYCNSCGYTKAVFVGSREIKDKKFRVKDLKTGKESELKI